jgi:hypothetical protein
MQIGNEVFEVPSGHSKERVSFGDAEMFEVPSDDNMTAEQRPKQGHSVSGEARAFKRQQVPSREGAVEQVVAALLEHFEESPEFREARRNAKKNCRTLPNQELRRCARCLDCFKRPVRSP